MCVCEYQTSCFWIISGHLEQTMNKCDLLFFGTFWTLRGWLLLPASRWESKCHSRKATSTPPEIQTPSYFLYTKQLDWLAICHLVLCSIVTWALSPHLQYSASNCLRCNGNSVTETYSGRSIQVLVRKTTCTESPDSSRLPQPMVYWDLPFPDWKCVSPPTSPFFSWHYFSTALS